MQDSNKPNQEESHRITTEKQLTISTASSPIWQKTAIDYLTYTINKTKKDMAINFIENGLDHKTTSAITGLNTKEIAKLAQSSKQT